MTPCLSKELTIRKSYIMRGKTRTPPNNLTAFWIDAAMEARGIASLRELADIAEVSHARIVQVRNGDSTTRDFIERLALAFTPAGADEHIADAILNEGLRAAFPRPEDTGEIELSADPPESYEDWPVELRQALAHTRTLPRASQEFVYKLWLEQARAHADIEERRREAERKLLEREALLRQ